MEKFDLYDKYRMKLNKTMVRGEQTPENCYRTVVHCVILNESKDKMLIQQRQEDKQPYPNMWDFSCGGSVISGESSFEGVERELSEELGIKFNFSNIRPAFTFNFLYGFNDFYILCMDVDLNFLSLQKEEVKTVKWATKEEIFNLIDSGEFISYHKSLIDLIFDVNTSYSIRVNKN